MSHRVQLPNRLYDQLQTPAAASGFASIPELPANSQVEPRSPDDSFDVLIARVDRRRERLRAERGTMPDCVPLIREDRDR